MTKKWFPHKSIAGALAVSLLVPAPGLGAAKVNSSKLRKAVTVEGVRAHQQVLQDIADAAASAGTRASGTPGYDKSAAYVARRMSAAGYDVTIQPFTFPFFQELALPVLQQISPTPVTIPGPEGAWTVTVSQPFPLMVAGVVERMQKSGVKTVAFIGFSDALGDLAYDSLVKSAEKAGIKVVANERYARSDSSVAGQVLKIVAQRPDAVFAGNSGTPGALPYLALAERGYKGRIYGTHGLINADFVRVGGAAINGLQVPSGPVLVADQLPDSNPIKKVSLAFRNSYQKTNGALPTDAFSSYTYDAYLLLADAAKRTKGEPGTPQYRTALRDAIVATHELVGTHGVYNFKADNRYGSDERAVVIVRMEKGQWKLAQ